MMMRLQEVCRDLQERGRKLAADLRASGDRNLIFDAERIEERIAAGELPYANSEICPVGAGGSMQVRVYGTPELVVDYAERSLASYEELDEYGRIAMEWALLLSQSARRVLARIDGD
jgi:hypothetical protein